MGKFWRKEDSDLEGSPEITMGFTREMSTMAQNFLIKKYDFSSIEQVEDIKRELLGKKILIVNAKQVLNSIDVTKLKRGIDDLKRFLRDNGGSMARLGEQYLILTPNSLVRIAN